MDDFQVGTSASVALEEDCTQSDTIIHDPYVGLQLDSLEDMYDFYNFYARETGFGIRKSSSSKSHASKELIWKRFECDKAGLKVKSDGNDQNIVRRRDTRTGCPAKLDVKKNKQERWEVTVFAKEHNHTLDTPRRTRKHRSHNISHKSIVAKNLMEQLHGAGIGPSIIAKALNATDLSSAIRTQNVIDHLRVQRRNNVGREGVLVAQYLQTQMAHDSNFYFALELDNDGVLRSIFWADSRARNDYFIFGDVVVFDVTYKTNNLMMPFAPFTGVNHHRQTMLFGCALLADESEETFVWLFSQWLKCMFDRQPLVIITDMDAAMFSAIKTVFPSSRHRWCSWHISKHVVEHVYAMRDPQSDFPIDYKNWYYSKTVSISEEAWTQLILKHQLESNNWMIKMWANRYHWVPAFLKDIFTAGMTSTGRSESINAFFDGFVNASTHLLEFVKQYEKAILARRQSEEYEDFQTMNSSASLISKTSIEAHAGKCYTRNIFQLFQCEFKCSLECWHEKLSKISYVTTYLVGLSCEEKYRWNTVTYNGSADVTVLCDCGKFETDGYICRHILHILDKKHHLEIPNKYILKRWTIEARHIAPYGGSQFEDSNLFVTPFMKWSITSLCHKLIDKACVTISSYKNLYSLVTTKLDEYRMDERASEADVYGSQVESTPFSCDIPEISIRDPEVVRTKGRPRNASRISSGLEQSQSIIKKRTCGYCGQKGHYATTCPKKSKDKQ